MTEILFYENPMITECSAKVLSCEPSGENYNIILDRSMIFPEMGGQLSDTGKIDDIPVISAIKAGDDIIHVCTAPLEIGKTVSIRLDIPPRLDHTEQHTGEHILSGLASKLFGAKNVGFHMAPSYCTIDFDIFLDADQLNTLERAANAAVRANLPIHAETVSFEESSRRTLRKQAEKLNSESGDVRIVYIDNGKVDSCTCCGTHFPATGMVGSIKITDGKRYKGGTRLPFLCGARAVDYAIALHDGVCAVAREYSTSPEELPVSIHKQQRELSEAKAALHAKAVFTAELYSEKLLRETEPVNGIFPIVIYREDFSAEDVKQLQEYLTKKADSVILIFTKSEQNVDYRMMCSKGLKLSMKELCSAVNPLVRGKGGGNAILAQGKTAYPVTDDIIETLRNYLCRMLSDRS